MSIFKKEFNLQEMLTSSDIAKTAGMLINEYLINLADNPTFDNMWRELFYVDGTDKEVEILPSKMALAFVFNAVGPGEEPKFCSVSDSANILAQVIKYRTAGAFDIDMIKYNRKSQLERILSELRKKAGEFLANLHYQAVIVAGGAGTPVGGTTPVLVGQAIETAVTTMINLTDPIHPTHVVTNIANEALVRTSLDKVMRQAYVERNMSTAAITLSDATYNLKVIGTRWVPATDILVVESKRNLVSFYDMQDGELKIDEEDLLLTDSKNIYGKIRRAVAVCDNNAVTRLTI